MAARKKTVRRVRRPQGAAVGDSAETLLAEIGSRRESERENIMPARSSPDGQPYFYKVPQRVLARGDLSAGAVLLWSYLLNVESKEKKGKVAPYQATPAEALHVHRRTIRRYVTELTAAFLLSSEKRGRSQSSVYSLHDSWNYLGADDLVIPWSIHESHRTDSSAYGFARGQFRPKASGKAADAVDISVLRKGHQRPVQGEKNLTTRTTRVRAASKNSKGHSVPGPPPEAASPGSCKCGDPFPTEQVRIVLEELKDSDGPGRLNRDEDWTCRLGRVVFEINMAQLHCHPQAEEFLRFQLALIVVLWERTHELQFDKRKSRRRYHGSPYTSLDVQRFALATLEQNPALSITDLVHVVRDGSPVIPTPKGLLAAFGDLRKDSVDGPYETASLDAEAACRAGLHEMAIAGLSEAIGKRIRPSRKSRRQPSEGALALSLARDFHAKVDHPLGGSVRSLANRIRTWLREGNDSEVVKLMIDEFISNRSRYCPNGKTPWKQFIFRREELVRMTERKWVNSNKWKADFEDRRRELFGEADRRSGKTKTSSRL